MHTPQRVSRAIAARHRVVIATEAIELFHNSIGSMRQQLGHRVADAYMLVAKAYDLLGEKTAAQDHFEKATLLAPVEELFRRYPETATLRETCKPAEAPRELAA